MRARYGCFLAAFAFFLQGCSSVDQYGARIYDGNLNSQNALNQELLLNIVRASRFQSPNFVAITQITGAQSEQLTTGLPTISIGPAQTAANHVYQLSNSVVSGVTGGYQANPLISTAFEDGMLSPVSPRTVALLSSVRPPEVVFFLLIDSIQVTLPKGEISLLRNIPSYNEPGSAVDQGCDLASQLNLVLKKPKESLYPASVCNYTKFTYLLHTLMGNGLHAELVSSGSAGASAPASATSTTPNAAAGAQGQLCLDPAFAGDLYDPAKEFNSKCESSSAKAGGGKTVTTANTVKITDGKTETTKSSTVTGPSSSPVKQSDYVFDYPRLGKISITFRFRSPVGVINYLGSYLQGDTPPAFGGYISTSAKPLLDGEHYLDIISSDSKGCYTSIEYMGTSYCVPASSRHTPLLMDLVEDLRNLSIQPTDLNSAFTVRLSP